MSPAAAYAMTGGHHILKLYDNSFNNNEEANQPDRISSVLDVQLS